MNERTVRDRFHALGPLVLRIGIALILVQNGLQRTAVMFGHEGAPAMQADTIVPEQAVAATTPDGLQLRADWGMLLGAAELAAAALLLIGLTTRLVVLPTLAVLGYGLFAGFPEVLLPVNTTVMWLLAVACLSLFVSGGGSCALRRRWRGAGPQEAPPVVEQPAAARDFIQTRRPLAQRIREWFGHWRTPRHPAQPAAATPTRRWRWGRR